MIKPLDTDMIRYDIGRISYRAPILSFSIRCRKLLIFRIWIECATVCSDTLGIICDAKTSYV